jgi:hypothetical protein
MNPLSAAIMAGGTLLSGMMGSKATQDANAANAALSREFAQHGIGWKVADAKEAGIHPLAALGANTIQPQPMQVDNSMGQATRMATQQLANLALTNEDKALDIDLKKLRNQLAELELTAHPHYEGPTISWGADGTPETHRDYLDKRFNKNATPPLYVDVYDKFSGRTLSWPNPDYNSDMQGIPATWSMQNMMRHDPNWDIDAIYGGR